VTWHGWPGVDRGKRGPGDGQRGYFHGGTVGRTGPHRGDGCCPARPVWGGPIRALGPVGRCPDNYYEYQAKPLLESGAQWSTSSASGFACKELNTLNASPVGLPASGRSRIRRLARADAGFLTLSKDARQLLEMIRPGSWRPVASEQAVWRMPDGIRRELSRRRHHWTIGPLCRREW